MRGNQCRQQGSAHLHNLNNVGNGPACDAAFPLHITLLSSTCFWDKVVFLLQVVPLQQSCYYSTVAGNYCDAAKTHMYKNLSLAFWWQGFSMKVAYMLITVAVQTSDTYRDNAVLMILWPSSTLQSVCVTSAHVSLQLRYKKKNLVSGVKSQEDTM